MFWRCVLEIKLWCFIFDLKVNYDDSDLVSRYSIIKYKILDSLSGWFRDWSFSDWVTVACPTRHVYLYVSVSFWSVNSSVLEIVAMDSCIAWLMCFVIDTKVNSVLLDLLFWHAVLYWLRSIFWDRTLYWLEKILGNCFQITNHSPARRGVIPQGTWILEMCAAILL